MQAFIFHSRINDGQALTRLFRRDCSVKPMRPGLVRNGVLVMDVMTAAEAGARTLARRYCKTAEVMLRQDGYLANGGEIYVAEIWTRGVAEIWTRGRTRFLALENFAIATE